VAWTTADIPDQSGRVAVVIGANGGLGLEVARALARRGARVAITSTGHPVGGVGARDRIAFEVKAPA
jgi:NAD(P)-dependent dehydrogenase (short-subunit alcohol dehydrogenase family)